MIMEHRVVTSKKVFALVVLILLSLNVFAQPRGLDMRSFEGDAMRVVVNNPGELQSKIPEKMVSAIRRLKVEGTLSKDDISFLRKLAMRSSLQDTLGHRLDPFFDLDLMDANIYVGGVFGIRTPLIPDHFLNHSSLLRRIYLPVNTEYIGDYAFEDCKNLREVHMPMSVNHIGSCAFKGCRQLTEVSSPKALSTLENGCFEDCQNLQHFTLFDNVVNIGNTAFRNTAITQMRIPDSVRKIGDEAFANTALQSINIPDDMENINARAFEGLKNLQNIEVSSINSHCCVVDGVLFNKAKTVVIRVLVNKDGAYKVPEGVTAIGRYAFSGCQKISDVQLPKSLQRIGEGAFMGTPLRNIDVSGVNELQGKVFAGCGNLSQVTLPMLEQLPASIFEGCSSLASIDLPKSLKSIGNASFKGCQKLAKIELPQTLTTIDDEAFRDCLSLESLEYPQSVTTIGNKTLYGCKNLKSVTCPWQEPLKIKDVIDNKSTVLRVPSGTDELYKKAKGWKKFKQIEAY